MKVTILIAGAGGMYCGSCIRDNRLAATLRGTGRDVTLLPLYTPIRTDEEDVSEPTVHYGGVNVYLQQKSPLFRHAPAVVDRILDSPALLRGIGRLAVKTQAAGLGAMTVSILRGPGGAQRKELFKLVESLKVIRPAVVHLPNLMMLGMARTIRETIGAAVVCSLSGEDIFLDALPEPHRAEAFSLIRESATDVDFFLAPTRYYAGHCEKHFELPRDRIVHIPMGIRTDDFDGAPRHRDGPFTIGYLARICPEKGLHHLADVYLELRRRGHDCRVIAAGYLGSTDREYLAGILGRIQASGASDGFEYRGEVTREGKVELLRSVDAFCVPTVYHEAKGLYVLEAMAAGTCVVLPEQGAFPELVQATGGGRLYDPLQPESLIRTLIDLKERPDERLRHGESGKACVRSKFTDRQMAERTWDIYEKLVSQRSS